MCYPSKYVDDDNFYLFLVEVIYDFSIMNMENEINWIYGKIKFINW